MYTGGRVSQRLTKEQVYVLVSLEVALELVLHTGGYTVERERNLGRVNRLIQPRGKDRLMT